MIFKLFGCRIDFRLEVWQALVVAIKHRVAELLRIRISQFMANGGVSSEHAHTSSFEVSAALNSR